MMEPPESQFGHRRSLSDSGGASSGPPLRSPRTVPVGAGAGESGHGADRRLPAWGHGDIVGEDSSDDEDIGESLDEDEEFDEATLESSAGHLDRSGGASDANSKLPRWESKDQKASKEGASKRGVGLPVANTREAAILSRSGGSGGSFSASGRGENVSSARSPGSSSLAAAAAEANLQLEAAYASVSPVARRSPAGASFGGASSSMGGSASAGELRASEARRGGGGGNVASASVRRSPGGGAAGAAPGSPSLHGGRGGPRSPGGSGGGGGGSRVVSGSATGATHASNNSRISNEQPAAAPKQWPTMRGGSSSTPAEIFGRAPSEPSDEDSVINVAAPQQEYQGQNEGEYAVEMDGAGISTSWRDSLERYPSLLRLYPLAAPSEAGEGADEPDDAQSAIFNEECASSHPGSELDAQIVAGALSGSNVAGATSLVGPNTRSSGSMGPLTPKQSPVTVSRSARSGGPAQVVTGSTPPRTPGRGSTGNASAHKNNGNGLVGQQGVAGPGSGAGPADAGAGAGSGTPRNLPPGCQITMIPSGQGSTRPRSSRGGGSVATPSSAASSERLRSASGCWSTADLASAWAEVDQVRRALAARERSVAQREAAVRRAEAKNLAAARQLSELRHRLDAYGEELEEGVLALTSQQQAMREERRQTRELQAKVRRMCASAVREDVVNGKIREWDRPWTPTPSMGGPDEQGQQALESDYNQQGVEIARKGHEISRGHETRRGPGHGSRAHGVPGRAWS